MKKTVVTLGLYRMSIPIKIETTRKFVTSITGNPKFPTPNPPLAAVTTANNALETAHIAAIKGGVDDTANMHAKEEALDLLLKILGNYVEAIANADPVNAEAIVKSAGMDVKASNRRTSSDFEVKTNGVPGEVKLSTRRVTRGTLIWQMNTDPGNEAGWQTIGMGTRASMIKTGLSSGSRYYFRVAVVDKNGQGPWSHTLNVIVQ